MRITRTQALILLLSLATLLSVFVTGYKTLVRHDYLVIEEPEETLEEDAAPEEEIPEEAVAEDGATSSEEAPYVPLP